MKISVRWGISNSGIWFVNNKSQPWAYKCFLFNLISQTQNKVEYQNSKTHTNKMKNSQEIKENQFISVLKKAVKKQKRENVTKCYICEAFFIEKTNLLAHISSVHQGKKPHKCSICDYNCSWKEHLTTHISSIHEGKKPFKCSICDYNCSQKGTLRKHMTSVHEAKEPFKCFICDYL